MAFWAFAIPLFLCLREAKKLNFPGRPILVLAYFGGWIGFSGARMLGILLHLIRHPVPHNLKNLVLHSGSAYLGGLIAALVFAAAYLRFARISFWKMLDFLGPYVTLGEGIGRLGCFLAGCCYGIVYGGPFAVTSAAGHGHMDSAIKVSRFPVQPLAFLAGLASFCILIRLRGKMRFEGQLGLLSILLYATIRSLLELLRGDEVRGLWFGERLSSSQIISMLLMSAAAAAWAWKRQDKLNEAKAEGRPN